jgi:hypothetical protein
VPPGECFQALWASERVFLEEEASQEEPPGDFILPGGGSAWEAIPRRPSRLEAFSEALRNTLQTVSYLSVAYLL